MQVSSLHEDVVVCRSMMWQVTCTLVHHGEETFVVDSPVFQDELDALPALLGQAGWSLSGLLATHGDWDHVMARYAFPDAALGVAETTAARLRAEPGDAQRSIREFDEENYVERPRPLSLGQVQALRAVRNVAAPVGRAAGAGVRHCRSPLGIVSPARSARATAQNLLLALR